MKKFRTEEKEFILLKKEKGFSPKQITESLNKTFNSNRTISSIQHFLSRNNLTQKHYDNAHFDNNLKNKILELHSKGLNSKEIGNIVGKSNKSINRFLNKNNLNTSNSIFRILSEEEIKDICERYENGESAEKILLNYSQKIKCPETIIKILKTKDIEIRKAQRFTKIINEDFFEKIDSEEKAYILGFLITDGYIIYPSRENRTPFWGITLKKEDKYLLEEIKTIIGIDKKIYNNDNNIKNPQKRNAKTRNESILSVTSFKMVKDLEKYGITTKKSKTIKFPNNIPSEFMPHFIRGIFDGDGCISKKIISFSGNEIFLKSLQDFLNNTLKINKNKIYEIKYFFKNGEISSNYSFMFSSKKDVENFYNYIYKDAKIYLTRKKEKFKLLPFIN